MDSVTLGLRMPGTYANPIQIDDRNAPAELVEACRLANDAAFRLAGVRSTCIMLAEGGRLQTEIAKDFGVTQGVISNLKAGRSWRHVRRGLPS